MSASSDTPLLSRLLGKTSGEGGKTPNQVVADAVPDTSHHPLPCDGDFADLEAGWHKLALHTRPDAVAALEVAAGREPDLLPSGAVTEIPVQLGIISERWTRRLAMCDPTAAHVVLAQDSRAEAFFIDPLTDMPVLHTPDNAGKQVWRFYTPLSPGDHQGEPGHRPANASAYSSSPASSSSRSTASGSRSGRKPSTGWEAVKL